MAASCALLQASCALLYNFRGTTDGRDGPEPRCFPKRVEGEKCHESWQCAPILDGDVYYPGMCNHHGRCVIFQNAYPLEC